MSGLRSVEQAPSTAAWPDIVADLGYPGPAVVGRVLGVDPIHVDGWNQTGSAPKWACLALWWLTTWGRAQVHEQAVRDAQLAMQCLRAVEKERDALLIAANRPAGRALLAAPTEFDRLPFAQAPAAATWLDSIGRERQRPASVFMGGTAARGRRTRLD